MEAVLDAQAVGGGRRAGVGLAFMPVVDGATLPARPEAALAAGSAAGVSVLVGTTRDEMRLFSAVAPGAFAAEDEATLLRHVAAIPDVGPVGAATVVGAYRRRWPGLPPTDLHVIIHTDHAFRRPAQRLATLQVEAGAEAWSYWFTWASPILGGLLGSYHGLEIPFVFDNLDRPGIEMLTGGGGHLQPLADRMADAWLGFARDGDPGWPAYEPAGDRSTMRFDLPPSCSPIPIPTCAPPGSRSASDRAGPAAQLRGAATGAGGGTGPGPASTPGWPGRRARPGLPACRRTRRCRRRPSGPTRRRPARAGRRRPAARCRAPRPPGAGATPPALEADRWARKPVCQPPGAR